MPTAPRRTVSEWSAQDVDRNGLVMLERAECLRLLGTATLGRVGLTSGALPTVLPVDYVFDGEQILICTSPGTKLEAATRDTVVAFEIDEIDPVAHTGWSVMVQGMARHVTDPVELDRISQLRRARWAPGGDGGNMVAIRPEIVSGRRVHPGPGEIDGQHHH